ncbi:phage tail tape measure protein [Pseudomonas sp. AN-1]|uniref:phage tail tape measure protein n=1 Tax=Pseudomonas sp. AN-1 TaxID=3096605 RepID=UPI002A69ABDE|nr:phage tail tape measure protein [Pseudomonas sp. AN-1]WPP47694.1 phage tail tape measure protein [Pseudomonas sp. AN-1]
MARDLKLEVLLSAVDKITAPLRNITRGSSATAQALKASRDQLKQLQAQQRDISSFRTLKTATQQTEAAMAASQAKVRELAQAMAATSTPTKAMAADFKRAQREAQALKQKHGEQQRELQELRGKLSAAGISTRNLGEHERALRQRVAETSGAIDRQTASLKRATKQQELLAKAKEQYERTQGVAGSMAGSGAAGLATGTGILYGAARMAAPQVAAEQQGALIAAQGGKGAAEAAQYAKVIRDIRAAGIGEDMAAVGNAVAAVNSTLQTFGAVSAAELDSATRKAINLATAMGGDVAEHAQMAGILMQNGLAKNSDQAFDLITAGMQKVSAQMRGELPEIIHEYSTHFRGMGFSGQEAMNLLVAMAKQGKFALDKTGDAIKEFSIRGSDMSKKSVEAYEAIGLNAEKMSSAIAGGGDGARKALQQTAKGLLAIKDPAERANTAIALFGTPVEDLAVDQIPAFLQALSGSTDNLGNVAGAADQLGKTLNDNLAGDLSSLSGAWGELNATLTDGHSSALRQVTKGLTETIGSVRAWAQANPALASGLVKLAVGFGMLVAAGGALTLVLASVLGPFAMVRYGLAMIGIKTLPLISLIPKVMLAVKALGGALWALAANPVVLTIAAIAAGAYLLWRNWGTLGPKFAALWAGIKATFEQTMGWFATLPTRFFQFGADILTGLANGITSALGSVKTAVTGAGEQTIGWFKEKLGIHSPSRVFAELGGYTMQGLDQGLTAGQAGPLKTIAGMGKQLAAAGALSVGMGAGSALAIDNRPPLAAAGQGGGQIVVQGDTITIQISGAGGQSDALAREINRILDERERGKAARVRSLLGDRD